MNFIHFKFLLLFNSLKSVLRITKLTENINSKNNGKSEFEKKLVQNLNIKLAAKFNRVSEVKKWIFRNSRRKT